MLRPAYIAIFVGILALSGAVVSAAGIYKWVDAEGNVHYGQERPRNTAAEEVKIKVDAPAETSTQAAVGEAQPGGQSAEDPAAAKREIDSKNCEISKANLKILQGGGQRLMTSNPDGSTKYWAEEERQAKIAEAQKQVNYFCSDKPE